MDIIDTERLCVLPSFVVLGAPPFQGLEIGCDRTEPTGTFNECTVRWPLLVDAGRGIGGAPGLSWEAGVLRCRSLPRLSALAVGCSDALDGAGVVATFLKVIWHSMSSPAKTVCSVHCT